MAVSFSIYIIFLFNQTLFIIQQKTMKAKTGSPFTRLPFCQVVFKRHEKNPAKIISEII